jgi:UDP-N-acetylmuramate dehydrogenase
MNYQKNKILAPFTTVKIGGPAEFFIVANSKHQLQQILDDIPTNKGKKITILGNGSNILISDKGIKGFCIKNNSSDIKLLPNNQIEVDSGVQLSRLIDFSLQHHLTGLETFAYIPSTVGGAIAGNIHGTQKTFDQFVTKIQYHPLHTNIILSAIIQLQTGDSQQAQQTKEKIINHKKQTQPTNSLGCIFKNPSPDKPAGYIIDQLLKLKGHRLGDAQISEKHANFIVNNGKATAKDYYALITLIQNKAKKELNINLELEIKLLGKI